MRRLRRPEDAFVYEPVFVGSFEDAFCAAAVNPALISVVVPKASRTARATTRRCCAPCSIRSARRRTATCRRCASPGLKRMRPELDVYLLSDRHVEELAGDPAADCVRRVFYAVEEPLELHLVDPRRRAATATTRRSSTT